MGLTLPSSEQMSVDIGASVFAYQPVDFPYHDALVKGDITPDQLEERAQAILDAWVAYAPDIEGNYELDKNIIDLARGYNAQIFGLVDDKMKTPYFAMTLPSSALDGSDLFRFGTGMRIDGSEGNIPTEDRAYISVQHELGHAVGFLKGEDFATLYDEEAYAEGYALDQYLQAGGSIDVVKEVIDTRAMEAFFAQGDEYWIAPALSNQFFDSDFDDSYDGARAAHSALRSRVASDLLDDYHSGHLEDALADGVLAKDDLQKVLFSVYDAAHDENEDQQVRWLAQMVLDGAQAHMPAFLPVNHVESSGHYQRDEEIFGAEPMFV